MDQPSSFAIFLATKYYPTVSKISLTLAFLVILFMIILSLYNRRLVDRVSLRLQTGLSVYDVWLHGGAIWRSISPAGANASCTARGYLALFFNVFYAFLNVSIAINLQLVFLNNQIITKKMEVMYWLIPLILSLILSIPPLALGQLGYSDYYGCYIADNENGEFNGKMLDLFANQIWRSICMIYLIVIVIIVILRLNQNACLIKKHKYFRGTETSKRAENSVKTLAYRILLYPLVMVFTQFPGIISQYYYDLNKGENPTLDQWSLLVLPFAGTLNFIAFCCDPTVHSAIKKIYLKLKYKYFISKRIKKDINLGYEEQSSTISMTNNDSEASHATADSENTMVSNFMKSL